MTGTALGASAGVIVLGVAVWLIRAIIFMVFTRFIATMIGLNNSKSAIAYGGLMGTTSGVAGRLAALDKRLVPDAAMPATFYSGPSIFYLTLRATNVMG